MICYKQGEPMFIDMLLSIYSILFQAMLVIILLIFVLKQNRNERIKRKEKSLYYITKWNSSELINAEIKTIFYNYSDEMNSDRLINGLNENDEYIYHVIFLLNFFEEMSIAIDNYLTDEMMLIKNFSSTFNRIYEKSEKIIYYLRKVRGNNNLYRSLEKMYGKWSFKYMLSNEKRYNNE